MQILKRMKKEFIANYYHMTTMDECELDKIYKFIVKIFSKS